MRSFGVAVETNKLDRLVLSIPVFVVYLNGGALAQIEPDGISVESATWRLEFDNDVFFGKDNKISSGWALQKQSAVAESWDALKGVPRFVKSWGTVIPTLTKEGLVYRAGIAVGQVIQTPNDLSRSDLIEDDVPYAGALTLQASWYAFSNERFRGFEITTGIVGSYSLAEQTQKTVHNWIDSDDPKGWDNQLSTELLINCTYMRKMKVWSMGNPAGLSFDAAIDGDIELGNLVTKVGTALEMRLGRNIPGGFMSLPDPIGFGMHYKASLKPANPHAISFYGTLALRANAFAYNVFLDGNAFRDSHGVDREPLVGQITFGLHFEHRHWGIHFYTMESTDDVDTHNAPAAEGRERVGSIMLEWRF